jgi:PAS domain S-box-containing protein
MAILDTISYKSIEALKKCVSMNDDKYRVLILDDDYELGELLKEYLQNTKKCDVTYVSAESDLWERLSKETFDILFLDYKLQQTTGLEILARMGQAGVTVPTVMMTGEGSENIAVRAIQSGAFDYLVKGEYSFTVLPQLIQKAVRLREMQRAMQQYLEQIRYQATLLDNMRDAVVVWGLNGVITYWNAAAEQLYGAPAAERVGKKVDEVYFPCFDPPLKFEGAAEAGSQQIEHRFRPSDRPAIWVSAHFTTLYGEENRRTPIGAMNVARDITPRKQEQEALLQSQHFIQRILDTSPNIIYILNLRTRKMRYINPEVQVILGYPVEAFVRAPFERFVQHVHGDDLEKLTEHLEKCRMMKDGEALEVEYRFLSKTDEWRWLKSRETVFSRGANGQPVEVIGVIQDVTKSKLAEERLQKSEARYRAIVEDHQTEMICRFFPDLQLNFVNEAYCRFYNQERGDLLGASFLQYAITEETPGIQAQLEKIHLDDPVIQFGQRVRLISGEVRWLEWVCRAIFNPQNVFLEVQAVGRDITERKAMEEKLKTAQTHLTQAARLASIGELAASVAHQISNPLTTIIADAQILSHELGREDPSQESAQAIIQAGWRAQEVISELMKFSQPAQVVREPVHINETIEKALLLAGGHLHASGVRLVTHLAADLPEMTGNPRQLTDLWVNLLLLARSSFSGVADPTIQIVTKMEKPCKIVVKVTDNGTPISPEGYDTIFEPQLIPIGSGRGTGMELSLCREIVRQNRGQIELTGNGTETTVLIQFPTEGL